jgi:hypothetical protein
MSNDAAKTQPSARPAWLDPIVSRVRFLIAITISWMLVVWVIDAAFSRHRGMNDPVVLTYSPSAATMADLGNSAGNTSHVIFIVLATLLLPFGSLALASIAGMPHIPGCMIMLGVTLSFWALQGGVIDDWLILMNVTVGPPRTEPYWRLLPDYLLLTLIVLMTSVLGAFTFGVRRGEQVAQRKDAIRRWLMLDCTPAKIRDSAISFLAICTVGIAGQTYLHGPALSDTKHLQTIFAVSVSFLVGAWLARKVSTHLSWSLMALAPILIGVIGLILAISRPGLSLPAGYQHLDMKPAWGLVRPLPIEMVAYGLVAVFWPRRRGDLAPAKSA